MEIVVGVENNDEGKFEESVVETLSLPKFIADPVVYKLVRVEGDGRFVPATDDEVMEVEDFLVDDKTDMHDVADGEETANCMSNEGSDSGKVQLESSEGLSHSGNAGADAENLTSNQECIDETAQKVKQEERLRVACGSPDCASASMNVESKFFDQHDKLPAIDEKLQSEIHMQEIVPSSESVVDGSCKSLSGGIGEFSKPSDGQPESGSSTSTVSNNGKPDFSMLKREICLDNLSIRELHELFKATFGRETTVKDKMWLRRRIAMGLTNSCDLATTTFTIKDNKLVKKQEESCKNANGTLNEASVVEAMNVSSKNSPTNCDSQTEDHEIVSDKRFNDSVELDFGNEDLHIEQRAAKRVRKPTKRYIEELSEAEPRDYSQKVNTSAKHIGFGLTSPKSCLRPVKNVSFNERIMLTRLDSLGGSGVQVPCVSRVRRSRPRKNIKALMRFNPNTVGMAAKVVKTALVVPSSEPDSESMDEVPKFRSASEQTDPLLTSEAERDKQCSAMGSVQLAKNQGLKQTDSSEDTSDDNIATVPTAKGGMRRKHHRAWTLVEVMKLVDGVSKCGAGRWSEIKRLAFASYSYRTSVDLKDKWRNLLKASFAQTPDEGSALQPSTITAYCQEECTMGTRFAHCNFDMMNSRKHASVPIPAQILRRVRQLAEMHSQNPPNLGSNSLGGVSGRSLHETRSGYL